IVPGMQRRPRRSLSSPTMTDPKEYYSADGFEVACRFPTAVLFPPCTSASFAEVEDWGPAPHLERPVGHRWPIDGSTTPPLLGALPRSRSDAAPASRPPSADLPQP